MDSAFEGFEVIHSYSRAQALADGVLVDVLALAREAGLRVPLALTEGVWSSCVSWSDTEAAPQDEAGRAWDVVWMAACAARANRRNPGSRLNFEVRVVPRGGRRAERRTLVLVIGPGDRAEAVGTVMFPTED